MVAPPIGIVPQNASMPVQTPSPAPADNTATRVPDSAPGKAAGIEVVEIPTPPGYVLVDSTSGKQVRGLATRKGDMWYWTTMDGRRGTQAAARI